MNNVHKLLWLNSPCWSLDNLFDFSFAFFFPSQRFGYGIGGPKTESNMHIHVNGGEVCDEPHIPLAHMHREWNEGERFS